MTPAKKKPASRRETRKRNPLRRLTEPNYSALTKIFSAAKLRNNSLPIKQTKKHSVPSVTSVVKERTNHVRTT
jgi:hypothetical protein